LVNSAKGLYLAEECLLSVAVERALGSREQPYAALSGPSFAKEIAKGMPSAVVVASKFLYHAVAVSRIMSSLIFRVYTSQDLIGVQLGGALKNPLAIGAGMVEGRNLGINTMAFYITRSQLELMLLCRAMGGDPETISGLSGVGDLILTCFGEQSRNRTCGMRIANGEKLSEITRNTTVEGVPTAKVACKFIDACGLDLPIFKTVAGILEEKLTLAEAQVHLMGRPVGGEKPH
jgi:glycerol-3-phosphate dehydrogenase (NAD+)